MKKQYIYRHGRERRFYEKGETPARYGIARQCEDGSYEFISDYGSFHKNVGCVWSDPPHHYLDFDKHPDAFIVNYNKPSSPKPAKFTY